MVVEYDTFGNSSLPIFKETLTIEHCCVSSTDIHGNEKIKFDPLKTSNSLLTRYDFKTMMDNEKIYVKDYNKGYYNENGEKIIETELSRYEEEKGFIIDTKNRTKIIKEIKVRSYIDRIEFAEHKYPEWINLRNCWLNVITKEAYYHNIDAKVLYESGQYDTMEEASNIAKATIHFQETHFFLSYIDVEYQKQIHCSNFDDFLITILPDEIDRKTIWEWFGFTLYNRYFPKKALILIGPKDSGKSTLLNVLRKFLGHKNVCSTSIFEFKEKEYALIDLYNKKANIQSDLESGFLKDSSIFRKLTGRDSIRARQIYEKAIEFVNTAKIMISQNELFSVSERELSAFFDRWNIIQFPMAIPRDEQIEEDELFESIANDCELSGILNKSLEGLNRLLKGKKFSNEGNHTDYVKLWTKLSNSGKWFFEEIITEGNETIIGNDYFKEELYDVYTQVCQLEKLPIQTDNTFVRKGTKAGFMAKKCQFKGVIRKKYENITFQNGYSDLAKKETNNKFEGIFESIRDSIENYLIMHPEGLSYNQIQEEMIHKKFNRQDINDVFVLMKEEGQIYEPQTDIWKVSQ